MLVTILLKYHTDGFLIRINRNMDLFCVPELLRFAVDAITKVLFGGLVLLENY